MRIPLKLAAAVVLLAASPVVAQEQRLPIRFGFGFSSIVTTGERLVALGFDTRFSLPYNRDLSFALDMNTVGFVLGGTEAAAFYLNPQLSAIVTLYPSNPKSPYIIGGFGGHILLNSADDADETGPTIHGGVGWVLGLQDTSIYIEVDPALYIGSKFVDLIMPIRVGIVL